MHPCQQRIDSGGAVYRTGFRQFHGCGDILADGVGEEFPCRDPRFSQLPHFFSRYLALGLHLPYCQGHAVDSFLTHAEHRGRIANGRHHRNDVLYGKAIRQQFL